MNDFKPYNLWICDKMEHRDEKFYGKSIKKYLVPPAPSNFTQHPFPRGVQHPQSRYMAFGFNIGISIDSWHLTIVTWSLVVIAMVYWVYRRFIPGFTAVHMSPPCFTACSYCSLMSGWCSNASLKISWDRCGRRPLRSRNWIKCSINGYQHIFFSINGCQFIISIIIFKEYWIIL